MTEKPSNSGLDLRLSSRLEQIPKSERPVDSIEGQRLTQKYSRILAENNTVTEDMYKDDLLRMIEKYKPETEMSRIPNPTLRAKVEFQYGMLHLFHLIHTLKTAPIGGLDNNKYGLTDTASAKKQLAFFLKEFSLKDPASHIKLYLESFKEDFDKVATYMSSHNLAIMRSEGKQKNIQVFTDLVKQAKELQEFFTTTLAEKTLNNLKLT